jgi:hypothetical protein
VDIIREKLGRLGSLAVRGQLSDWEQGFSESVFDQYKRRGRLSSSQVGVIEKILTAHNPEATKARNDWRSSFDEEKQALIRQAAEYYTANPPYFRDVARKILNDPAYIPSEKCFVKMTQNKYVQRWIAQREAGATFDRGQLVRFRRNVDVGYNHGNSRKGQLAVVVTVGADNTVTSAKGSRHYKVLPVGSMSPIMTHEKLLMRSKTA